jgi:hypothetical protein
MDSGITESLEPGHAQARVRFKCLWSDHYQLIRDVLGTASAINAWESAAQIERTFPMSYPTAPFMIGQAVESVEARGPGYAIPGLPPQWVTRRWAIVTIRFGVATFNDGQGNGPQDASGQPYTTTTFNVGGEFITLPDSTYTFPSKAPTSSPIGILVPQTEIPVTRHLMPFIPLPQMLALQGKVNLDPVPFLNFIFTPGQLLFVGGSTTITCDTLGNIMWDVTYQMMYRYIPWNYFLSPNPKEGWAVPVDGNGNPPLLGGIFATLP